MNMATITVFTPVYNRAGIIHSLYESLKQQSFKDFEWLIVDDGSKDTIEEVVQSFIKEGIINIRFYSQPNGGKHRAINKGVELAKGDLFFIVDSDDTITPDALEQLNKYFQQVKDDNRFAGVSGYRCFPDGSSKIQMMDVEFVDCDNKDFFFKHNPSKSIGGAADAYKLSILKQYPFPDIKGEKFCAESLVWNRISRKYIIRHFNKTIYIWNYLPDGLTKGMIKNRMNSPTYAMMNYSERLRFNRTPLKKKIKYAINYWRYYFLKKHQQKFDIEIIWYPFAIIGYFLYLRDKRIFS